MLKCRNLKSVLELRYANNVKITKEKHHVVFSTNDVTIITSATALGTCHRTPKQPTGQPLLPQANLFCSYPHVASRFHQPSFRGSVRTQGSQKQAELHCF